METILDETNPSLDQIVQWSNNEEIYFIEQDEDLIFHQPKYINILIKLASDSNCVKQKYCESILEYYIQYSLLRRNLDVLIPIENEIKNSKSLIKSNWLAQWESNFTKAIDLIKSPKEISNDLCDNIAKNLTIGTHSARSIFSKNILSNQTLEYIAGYGNYKEYFYINPKTANWRWSRHDPIENFA